jgi:adrenodoxin-NADP+ reductase
VAPDHPEVKQVQADFEAVAADPRFGFLGNVAVGRDVTVPELFKHYNAVVLAYGAASDRKMGIPGEDLANVFSARAFVNWYNGHPDFRNFKPNLEAEDVIIIGQGNVAIDCARILSKTRAELAETDIAAHALDALSASKVKRVHVVGRRGHVQAAFTMKELREVTRLADTAFVVAVEELHRGRTAASLAEIEAGRPRKRMDALLAETAAAAGPSSKSRELRMRFLLAPARVLPSATDPSEVGALEFSVTELTGEAEKQGAAATGKLETIKAGMVLRSIGYKSVPVDPVVPFDDKRSVVRNASGRVVHEDGSPFPGLYVSGWLKRGPTGIIGTNITDARETVGCMLADLSAGGFAPGGEGLAGLRAHLLSKGRKPEDLVSWTGFMRVNAAELAAGKAAGKAREKITDVAVALKVAGGA